jgi:hypothetical protein
MNTEQLIAHGRVRFDHAAAKRVLAEKYQAKMTFAHAGGMWCAGPELLTVLHACPVEDDIVILDLYKNPVQVNPGELQRLAHDRWQEQMNAWLAEHEEISKQR